MKAVVKRLWMIGAIAVLIACAARWRHVQLRANPAPTELDQPQLAAYWHFLADARRFVPKGSSYTIHAPTPDDETQLFFLSQGMYGDVEPKPRTYVWQPQPGGGKYVLVFGSAECPPDAPLMHPVKGGAVCVR